MVLNKNGYHILCSVLFYASSIFAMENDCDQTNYFEQMPNELLKEISDYVIDNRPDASFIGKTTDPQCRWYFNLQNLLHWRAVCKQWKEQTDLTYYAYCIDILGGIKKINEPRFRNEHNLFDKNGEHIGIMVNLNEDSIIPALHHCAKIGLKDLACVLIKLGANVNKRTRKGLTPLDTAIQYKQFDVAGLLINQGGQTHYDLTELDDRRDNLVKRKND